MERFLNTNLELSAVLTWRKLTQVKGVPLNAGPSLHANYVEACVFFCLRGHCWTRTGIMSGILIHEIGRLMKESVGTVVE